jgi:hypothetical protein
MDLNTSPHAPARSAARNEPGNEVAVRPVPRPARLSFDIRRLSLPGYTAAQHQRFTHTLHTSLSQLAMAHAGWPTAPRAHIECLDAGHLRRGATPEDAARQIATQIFERLARGVGDPDHV